MVRRCRRWMDCGSGPSIIRSGRNEEVSHRSVHQHGGHATDRQLEDAASTAIFSGRRFVDSEKAQLSWSTPRLVQRLGVQRSYWLPVIEYSSTLPLNTHSVPWELLS